MINVNTNSNILNYKKSIKMKQIKLLVVLVLIVFSNNAQAQTWTFDNSHSSVGFSVDHMVVSEVDGSFSKFTGSFISEKADFSDANRI